MFGKLNHIHFIGIGGSGMSGIALILKNLGYNVTGSDVMKSSVTESLVREGIKISYEHTETNCIGADVIVYSSAIKKDNPEITYATLKKIPVISRAEMLAELMRMKFSIAVSGTHGKTTVTSIISSILETAEFNPTVIIGGRVLGTDSGARLGQSQYLVCEADESDGSFLLLYPTIAVVTNIEKEHLDYYQNISRIKKAFVQFVNKVPFFGTVILGIDSIAVRSIVPMITRDIITFGYSKNAMVRAQNIKLNNFSSNFTLLYNGQSYNIKLNLAGRHNIQNALAAICVGLKLEIPMNKIATALESFSGVHRRLEFKGEKRNIIMFDDYGHHPTEIKATLSALRNAYPKKRIIVIFQPHRYTRTQALAKMFRNSFNTANTVVITKIYPASELPIKDVSSQLIIDAITQSKSAPEVIYKENTFEIVTFLRSYLQPNDVVITLGAGNIWQTGEELLKIL